MRAHFGRAFVAVRAVEALFEGELLAGVAEAVAFGLGQRHSGRIDVGEHASYRALLLGRILGQFLLVLIGNLSRDIGQLSGR